MSEEIMWVIPPEDVPRDLLETVRFMRMQMEILTGIHPLRLAEPDTTPCRYGGAG